MKTISKSFIATLAFISIIPNILSANEVPIERDCGNPYQYDKKAEYTPINVTRDKVTVHRTKPHVVTHDHRSKAPRAVTYDHRKKSRIVTHDHRSKVPRTVTHDHRKKSRIIIHNHRSKAPKSIKKNTPHIKVIARESSNRISKHIVNQHNKITKTTKKVLKKATKPLSSGIKIITSIF